jgi:hypothetical protein
MSDCYADHKRPLAAHHRVPCAKFYIVREFG